MHGVHIYCIMLSQVVCLSVHPLRYCIVSKRLRVSSTFIHRRIAPSFLFAENKTAFRNLNHTSLIWPRPGLFTIAWPQNWLHQRTHDLLCDSWRSCQSTVCSSAVRNGLVVYYVFILSSLPYTCTSLHWLRQPCCRSWLRSQHCSLFRGSAPSIVASTYGVISHAKVSRRHSQFYRRNFPNVDGYVGHA